MANYGMNFSPSKYSPPCSNQKSWPKTTGKTTTNIDPLITELHDPNELWGSPRFVNTGLCGLCRALIEL
jgi:hypothetical protein